MHARHEQNTLQHRRLQDILRQPTTRGETMNKETVRAAVKTLQVSFLLVDQNKDKLIGCAPTTETQDEILASIEHWAINTAAHALDVAKRAASMRDQIILAKQRREITEHGPKITTNDGVTNR